MANAVKFIPKLKELRIHLCSRSESSKGVRDFIEKSYVGLKKSNLKFPILIRECSGVQPKIWARYEFGKEVYRDVSNKSADQVLREITNLNNCP